MTHPIRAALEAYERAWNDLLGQCLSNPIRNAWGKDVDTTSLNEAHRLAEKALREPEPAPHWRVVLDSLTDFRHTSDGMVRGGGYISKSELIEAMTRGEEPQRAGFYFKPRQMPPRCLPADWRVERSGPGDFLVHVPGPMSVTLTVREKYMNQHEAIFLELCKAVADQQAAAQEPAPAPEAAPVAAAPQCLPKDWSVTRLPDGDLSVSGPIGIRPCRLAFGVNNEHASAYLHRLASDVLDQQQAEHTPAPKEMQDELDTALGLVELPPIRLPADVALYLKSQAHSRGVILQAHVRDLLGAVHASNAPRAGDDLSEELVQAEHGIIPMVAMRTVTHGDSSITDVFDPPVPLPALDDIADARQPDIRIELEKADEPKQTATPADHEFHTHRVAGEVLRERLRQVNEEDYTPEHDDSPEHAGALERAAATYAVDNINFVGKASSTRVWPWDWDEHKPREHRDNLVRAAALLLAAIERCDRIAGQPSILA